MLCDSYYTIYNYKIWIE